MKIDNKIVKLLTLSIWFLLVLTGMVLCGLKNTEFTGEDFTGLVAGISVVLGFVFHKIGKE